MTLPEQSDQAVAQTREFLVRLSSPYVEDGIKGIRREVRAEALRLLRHYPFAWYGDCPDRDNVANRDNTPAANATPSEGREQNGCTLTDAEREAVAYFAAFHRSPREADANAAATLRGLLERL